MGGVGSGRRGKERRSSLSSSDSGVVERELDNEGTALGPGTRWRRPSAGVGGRWIGCTTAVIAGVLASSRMLTVNTLDDDNNNVGRRC